MKERDLLNWVVACAERFGWKVYHVPAPMVANRKGGFVGSPRAAGLPDLFLLHEDPPRMIVAEVKGDKGKLSDKQREFLKMARDVADHSYLWTDTALDTEIPRRDGQRMFGVYAWTPNDQPIIEQMLRSKVLL